ncbi:MAG: esterase-like activity of phytase family protein, partial [Hyphomicrobiaceae bacterium]
LYGKLEFRGGLVLSSRHGSFGGWSGIAVDPDGRRFMAVSDEGSWLGADLSYSGKAPAGIANARIGPLRALKGRHIDKKRDLDAESMTPLEGASRRGTVLIGFERNHRIGVFPVVDGVLLAPTRYLKLPNEARRMRPNAGFEAVAVMKGGPFKGGVVAFSERYPGDPSRHVGWIWVAETAHRMTLADHGGFDITDAASLTDGTLLVLERRFRWTEGVKMRLRLIEAAAVKPGADLDGEILLEADLSSEIDNMEGLGTHRDANGETVLTLISDNNFNSLLQRNLLLQFTLRGDRQSAERR